MLGCGEGHSILAFAGTGSLLKVRLLRLAQ